MISLRPARERIDERRTGGAALESGDGAAIVRQERAAYLLEVK